MISSQKRDGVFTFNMHQNPLLSIIVDNQWRKNQFKDITIYLPEHAKIDPIQEESHDPMPKYQLEKPKEWNDTALNELLGKFIDMKDIDKKDR